MSTKPSSPTSPPAVSRSTFIRDDIYWCTADPGWVTGTSYGIISPLANGVTTVIDQAEFDAERWYRILQDREGHGLVHGADRHSHVDEGGRRARGPI